MTTGESSDTIANVRKAESQASSGVGYSTQHEHPFSTDNVIMGIAFILGMIVWGWLFWKAARSWL